MAEKPVLKIGHLKISDHLILGVTDVKLKKGIENFQYSSLKTHVMLGWNNVADALTAKALDGAFILAPTAMDLFKNNVGIKLILFTHKAGSVLVKNKRANVQRLEDFKGKVVLIPYQLSVHNLLFHKLLADKGLKPGTGREPGVDVKLEVMAPTQMPEALEYDEEGEIGGFIVAEPIGSQAINAGYGEEVCLSNDLWPKHPCCVFVVRDEIIGKYPDAIHELCTSLVKSGQFIEEKPAAAAAIGADFLSQDKAVVERVLTTPKERICTDELFPVIEDLEMMQNYMFDYMKIIDSKIDLEKFIDTQFAKAANAK